MDLDIRNENELTYLCAEYKDILSRKVELLEKHKIANESLDRLYGFITDCFVDRFRLKGRNVKEMIPKLIELLKNYKYFDLYNFCIDGDDVGADSAAFNPDNNNNNN